jgi:lysyl-tRNA synthetase class 2
MQPMVEPRPWWHPDKHADRRPFLLARNRIKAAIRRWLESEGFVEVDTACLQVSPGNEAHLAAFRTEFRTEAGASRTLYLHTSPEFACKKLLAAGERRVFTFAPVFRNGERGALHSPEFTMLEWYRVEEPYQRLWDDCREILRLAAEAAATADLRWQGRAVAAGDALEVTTVSRAFGAAGIDLAQSIGPDGAVDRDALARAVAGAGIRVAPDDTWSDLFSRVMIERVEPALAGSGRATVLAEYPTHEAALARRTARDARVAERFELYACGVELANGFGELTDAAEQRRRFEAEMDEKERVYGERYPLDEDFLAALERMPQASGCALGFDRLVMLATGASHVEQALWTPVSI